MSRLISPLRNRLGLYLFISIFLFSLFSLSLGGRGGPWRGRAMREQEIDNEIWVGCYSSEAPARGWPGRARPHRARRHPTAQGSGLTARRARPCPAPPRLRATRVSPPRRHARRATSWPHPVRPRPAPPGVEWLCGTMAPTAPRRGNPTLEAEGRARKCRNELRWGRKGAQEKPAARHGTARHCGPAPHLVVRGVAGAPPA